MKTIYQLAIQIGPVMFFVYESKENLEAQVQEFEQRFDIPFFTFKGHTKYADMRSTQVTAVREHVLALEITHFGE